MDNKATISVRAEKKNSENEAPTEGGASENVGHKIARGLFYLLAFLMPIWVLPITAFPLALNKAYLAYFLIIGAFMAWLAGIIKEREINLPKSALLPSLAGIALVWLAASALSQSPHVSFIGLGHEAGTFAVIVAGISAAFLASVLFQNESYALKWYLTLFSSAALVFLFQISHTIFGFTPIFKNIFNVSTSTLLGGWNTFGIFSGMILVLALSTLDFFRVGWIRIVAIVVFTCSLFFLMLVNFAVLWWVLAAFLIILTAYFLTSGDSSKTAIIMSAASLSAVLFFVLAPGLASGIPNWFGINNLEARPSWGSTAIIVKNAVKENPVLGSGPNTFLYDWMKWKNQSINQTPFWNARFSAGVGLLPSFVAGAGILGLAAWIFFLSVLALYGFRATLLIDSSPSRRLLLMSFFAVLYMWIAHIFYAPDLTLFIFSFIISGIFVALAAREGLVKNARLILFKNTGAGFLSVIFTIFIFILIIGGALQLAQKYIAGYVFQKGAAVLSGGGDLESAKSNMSRAIELDERDVYLRALAEVDMLRLQSVLARRDLQTEELRSQFQSVLSSAIAGGRSAIQLNEIDPINWMSLGKVYELIIPLKVAGAAESAFDAYQKAQSRDPFNPEPVLAEARAAFASGDIERARSLIFKAIALKSDYVEARFLLTQLEIQAGNISEAIAYAEDAAVLAPNDLGVLFQLGLLHYQNNNWERAKSVLGRAVIINPSYSNARYFLGLIYGREGDIANATAQFEVILALNPDHPEVLKILSNLRSGRPVLSDISPPGPAPEEREELPVE